MCWAAVCQAIVLYTAGIRVSQLQLCDAAGRHPTDGATVDDMIKALRLTARIFAYRTRPLDHTAVYKYLTAKKPIVMVVDVGHGFDAHALCLRGLLHDGHWQAIVNEPNLDGGISVFTPFARVRAAWREGLVIAGRTP
jgi:hypothetical protein